MPALFVAMMLATGQDVSTLRLPSPPNIHESEPWTGPRRPSWAPVVRSYPVVACRKPPRGELVPYDLLPAEVVMDLRRTDPRISPPGGPFNATDASDGVSPFSRVIAAMRRGGRLAVAYEHGGRGYGITLLIYDADARTGLMAVSGLDTLNPRETPSGSLTFDDACSALERTLGV